MNNLDKTIAALVKSRNEAANSTLLSALSGRDFTTFDNVVRALIERRNKSGHHAVVALWHVMPTESRRHFAAGRGRMAVAMREAVQSPDDQLFANSCDIAESIDEFDLLPALVSLAERSESPRAKPALRVAQRLVSRLEEMTHASRDARDRQNTDMIRQGVLECLERSVERFRTHRRVELIEMFVALSGSENLSLRAILESPHHPCFATVVEILSRSDSPAVIGLVAEQLPNPEAPQVVRSVCSKRIDAKFLSALLTTPLDWSNPNTAKALARLKAIACLEPANFTAASFSDDQQVTAMRVLAATSAADEDKLDLAGRLLAEGSPAARQAACLALQPIAGQRANELVLRALDDPDSQVQLAAAKQLRERHIPGTVAKLLDLTDSPHANVQQAACEALPEFTVDGLLEKFDSLTDEQRKSTAVLLVRVDRTAPARLALELQSAAARKRLRAIEIVAITGLAPQVADALVERLEDEDHLVRAAAAEALGRCTSQDVRDALLAALGDRSPAVQLAARNSLRTIARPTTA